MEVWGIHLDPYFSLFKNLKAQIPEICSSAQESANFYCIIDFGKGYLLQAKNRTWLQLKRLFYY